MASKNIRFKLAEKAEKDESPSWSRVVPAAIIACVCAVLASPGSVVGPLGPVPRFALVTSRLAARDAGGEFEAEARQYIAPLVSELKGTVLVLGAASFASLLDLPGLGPNALPSEERPHLLSALAVAAAAAGARAPLSMSASNMSLVADSSVDAVVALSALCRSNTSAALAELRRVLKPAGVLVLMEPTLSLLSSTTRRLQTLASPLHEVFSDGCRLDGDVVGALDNSGWRKRRLARESFRSSRHWLFAPHAIGVFERA